MKTVLYLNIWRPQSQEANLPVYFWIHGGGNTVGTASSDEFNGANMAFRSNMVIVTINYRLGPLGWFTHPALRTGDAQDDSGNYGNLDFIKALEWVKDNISAFGGDPNNITIAGESSGAGNVLSLVISPLSTGLFHKGIMQSGSLSCASVSQGEGHANKKIKKLLINDGTAADGTQAQAILDTWTNAQIETYLRGKSARTGFGGLRTLQCWVYLSFQTFYGRYGVTFQWNGFAGRRDLPEQNSPYSGKQFGRN